MTVWPLRFRELAEDKLIFGSDAGDWFLSGRSFLDRYAMDRLTEADLSFLAQNGLVFDKIDDLPFTSFASRWSKRQSLPRALNYLIVVPTLRCNLSCSYCQVSRAAETARGFDWSENHLQSFIAFLDNVTASSVKIEFQGGEPLLRLDLLTRIRDHCRTRFSNSEFVVCTNLQQLTPEHWKFLEAEDTFVSTSLDGNRERHDRTRINSKGRTEEFFFNLEEAKTRLRPGHLSALPTIDPDDPPPYDELVSAFAQLGLTSIYLRPINYQGFARRREPDKCRDQRWFDYHAGFIDHLVQLNWEGETVYEEYYFSHCLRRALGSGHHNHVDLRNPNLLGSDYVVIDYDGQIYPTDEARMLSRIGQIDLSIGTLKTGIDTLRVADLNRSATNAFDPDCIHCPYQPFCGVDNVDDLSRHGRIDMPRQDTFFCRRHLSLFDKVFELIYSDDAKVHHSLAKWAGLSSWPENLSATHA